MSQTSSSSTIVRSHLKARGFSRALGGRCYSRADRQNFASPLLIWVKPLGWIIVRFINLTPEARQSQYLASRFADCQRCTKRQSNQKWQARILPIRPDLYKQAARHVAHIWSFGAEAEYSNRGSWPCAAICALANQMPDAKTGRQPEPEICSLRAIYLSQSPSPANPKFGAMGLVGR